MDIYLIIIQVWDGKRFQHHKTLAFRTEKARDEKLVDIAMTHDFIRGTIQVEKDSCKLQ